MARNFRERALRNSGRELENTVLMLAHHFDQQLQDFAVIQKDFVDYVRASGITSAADYRKRHVRPGHPPDAAVRRSRRCPISAASISSMPKAS